VLGGYFVAFAKRRISTPTMSRRDSPTSTDDAFLYVVQCTFAPGSDAVANDWVSWLRAQHLADVLRAGARSAEVIRIDGPELRYEVHYRFASLEDFRQYEEREAPRLRAEGLQRFPLELGLRYERRTGRRLHCVNPTDEAKKLDSPPI
jgi:hypothetical protein